MCRASRWRWTSWGYEVVILGPLFVRCRRKTAGRCRKCSRPPGRRHLSFGNAGQQNALLRLAADHHNSASSAFEEGTERPQVELPFAFFRPVTREAMLLKNRDEIAFEQRHVACKNRPARDARCAKRQNEPKAPVDRGAQPPARPTGSSAIVHGWLRGLDRKLETPCCLRYKQSSSALVCSLQQLNPRRLCCHPHLKDVFRSSLIPINRWLKRAG